MKITRSKKDCFVDRVEWKKLPTKLKKKDYRFIFFSLKKGEISARILISSFKYLTLLFNLKSFIFINFKIAFFQVRIDIDTFFHNNKKERRKQRSEKVSHISRLRFSNQKNPSCLMPPGNST